MARIKDQFIKTVRIFELSFYFSLIVYTLRVILFPDLYVFDNDFSVYYNLSKTIFMNAFYYGAPVLTITMLLKHYLFKDLDRIFIIFTYIGVVSFIFYMLQYFYIYDNILSDHRTYSNYVIYYLDILLFCLINPLVILPILFVDLKSNSFFKNKLKMILNT